jgi:hypothetical protein
MNNQEAIEILREKISPCVVGEWKKSVDMAISALQAKDVPNTNVGDTISRQAAIDIERRATVDTNPYHFEAHQKFTEFMDDPEISSYGRWQWSNGFNTALTAISIDLKNLPSAQPEQQHGRVFKGIVVAYPSYNAYPEYKGKPYFSIKYTENGQEFIGYSTYKLEVLSEYLKEYFMPPAQPERKKGCKIVKSTGHYGYCACDQCGKPVHPEDLFCSKCGADFREEDT